MAKGQGLLMRLPLLALLLALLLLLPLHAQENPPADPPPPAESDGEEESAEAAEAEESAEAEAANAEKDEKDDKEADTANVADRPSESASAAQARSPRLLRPPDIVEAPAGAAGAERQPGELAIDEVDLVTGKSASQTEGGTEEAGSEGAGNVADGSVPAGETAAGGPVGETAADAPVGETAAGERPAVAAAAAGDTPGVAAAAAGDTPAGVSAGQVTPGGRPVPQRGDGGLFSDEELEGTGFELPGIARGEEGFIPDTDPSDLFLEPRGSGTADFGSLLGESELPPGDVEGIIGLHEGLPGRGLLDNYARVVVPNGSITGSTENKQFHIEGGVIIYYNEVIITADIADIDEKNEVAVLKGSVVVDDPKYNLKTDIMKIFFADKRFQASGFVQFKKLADQERSRPDLTLPKKDRLREYFASREFQLFARDLHYNWESKELTAIGEVQLVHPSFSGTMDRVDYNDSTKQYDISGGVVLKVRDYDWIFENRLVEPEDEKRIRALTDTPTDITAERLIYSEESGVAQFYTLPGQEVLFDQRQRTIRASYIEVNDQTKDFYAEGTPEKQVLYRQLDGKWLFAGELIKREEVSADLAKALEEPMDVYADRLVYNFDRKRMELTGAVKIDSQTASLNAGEIIQDETAKFFLMRENVVIKPDEQGEVYASQVYLDTENDVITFVGLVQGKLFSADIAEATATPEQIAAGEGGGAPAEGVFSNAPGTQNQGSQQTGANIAEGEN